MTPRRYTVRDKIGDKRRHLFCVFKYGRTFNIRSLFVLFLIYLSIVILFALTLSIVPNVNLLNTPLQNKKEEVYHGTRRVFIREEPVKCRTLDVSTRGWYEVTRCPVSLSVLSGSPDDNIVPPERVGDYVGPPFSERNRVSSLFFQQKRSPIPSLSYRSLCKTGYDGKDLVPYL